MILDKVVLHDVGVFAGHNELDLTPPSPRQPVVLIGGLNGAGKTTLLAAIHLALYGPLASSSTRRVGSYDAYLRSLIHHRANPAEGAAVEVSFSVQREGEAQRYRVRRSWKSTGKSVREHVVIFRNDRPDPVLSRTWAEHVDSFLPRGIAGLFFFDGEQIEALADLDRSREVLRTALTSLLGLDLVERLVTDLAVVRRRHSQAHLPDDVRQRIDTAQEQVAAARRDEEAATAEAAAARLQAERADKRLFAASEQYRTAGGDLVEARERTEHRLAELRSDLTRIDDELRDAAAGLAPLLQIQQLVAELADQGQTEIEASRSRLIADILAERDAGIVAQLRTAKVRPAHIADIEQHLAVDRAQRTESHVEPIADLPHLGGVQDLLDRGFGEERRRLPALTARRQGVIDERDGLERMLAAIPDPDAIAPLHAARDAADSDVTQTRAVLARAEERLSSLRHDRGRAEDALERASMAAAQVALSADDDRRLIEHVDRVTATLADLRTAATRRHLGHISELVLDSLRQLLRKDNLVTAITIDPDSCTVELQGAHGRAMAASELSAGERQLLAVALLWGLARSTGQPLPVVIDTPLGRLDTAHRQHLLTRYFPNASHQVILLSTDTEIDDDAWAQLQPRVGHAYRLHHDDDTGATSVESGYFWER